MLVKDKINQLFLNQFMGLMKHNAKMLVNTFYYHKREVVDSPDREHLLTTDAGIAFDRKGNLITEESEDITPVLTVKFHGHIDLLEVSFTVPCEINNLGTELYDDETISFSTHLKIDQRVNRYGNNYLAIVDQRSWVILDDKGVDDLLRSIGEELDKEKIEKIVIGHALVSVIEVINHTKSFSSELCFNNLMFRNLDAPVSLRK